MANTTADKLNKIRQTKEEIKTAISLKGGVVGEVFSEYPNAITNLPTDPKTISKIKAITLVQANLGVGEIILPKTDAYYLVVMVGKGGRGGGGSSSNAGGGGGGGSGNLALVIVKGNFTVVTNGTSTTSSITYNGITYTATQGGTGVKGTYSSFVGNGGTGGTGANGGGGGGSGYGSGRRGNGGTALIGIGGATGTSGTTAVIGANGELYGLSTILPLNMTVRATGGGNDSGGSGGKPIYSTYGQGGSGKHNSTYGNYGTNGGIDVYEITEYEV